MTSSRALPGRSASPDAEAGPPASLVDLLRRRAEEAPERRAYTFLSETGEEEAHRTWGELEAEARAIAVLLEGSGAVGERVLLLYPPGLPFVAAFLGCLFAGAVAVPAYPPRTRRTLPRLLAIARDARPAVALTVSAMLPRIEGLSAEATELAGVRALATDGLGSGMDLDLAEAWRDPGVTADTLAFLQYTSGSTATPKGVRVTHGNLLHNEGMIRDAFAQSHESVVVGWLPLYHDMGLIGNVLQPLHAGARCILMSPYTFLQQPVRWLAAISHYRATTSGGPNFGYDLCVRKIGEPERARLDLSSWRVAYNGAEPVRAETLERFAAAFRPCGFRREAFYPCYGLAEATLFVSGGEPGAGERIARVEPAELERRRAVPSADGGGRALVGCGRAWGGQRLEVADPDTGEPCEEGQVGEIWVAGPSVAAGYWGNEEATARDFGARLAEAGAPAEDPGDGAPVGRAGAPAAPAGASAAGSGAFLRTGDLGFLSGGELFVTGRIKDLIILRGRNLYPQDVERTAERSHPALAGGAAAAFSVEAAGEERLVVVHEVDRHTGRNPGSPEPTTLAEAIRRAVAEEHEARVWEVVLVREGTVPRTSSGKIQRHACRAAYLAGTLAVVGRSALDAPGPSAPGDPQDL